VRVAAAKIDSYRRPALTVIVPDTIDEVPLDDRTAYRSAVDTDINPWVDALAGT
jgi:hypothetical protein